jgi:hypothetical protein
MTSPADLIEEQISSVELAWGLLNKKLPEFDELFNIWHSWFCTKVTDVKVQKVVTDTLVISYARMALRNGTLSIQPRSYHSEIHVNDLIYRLIAVSHLSKSKGITAYGWALLSIFMAAHDLRQSEINDASVLVGNNEQASYQELNRILALVDKHKTIRQEHKELLKLMIHGSTFGRGEDTKGNIYIGNLVRILLEDVAYFDDDDKELAYLACDIDTANVSADLTDYAQSSINVYNEIQTISGNNMSAQLFFGTLQEDYFFELQKFNSELGKQAFADQKLINTPKIKTLCKYIKQLDSEMENDEVVAYYQAQIKKLS